MFENNESLYPMVANISDFISATKQKYVKEEKNYICFNYFYPLLYEKVAIYFLIHNQYRKFQIYIAHAGDEYSNLTENMNIYALNSLSYLLKFLDIIDSSFINVKLYYNNKLGEICKKMNLWEAYFKFSKNCFELLKYFKDLKEENIQKYLNEYLSSISIINNNKIICLNVDLNSLEIPNIENNSLFILEENDYKIKLLNEELKELNIKTNNNNPIATKYKGQ